MNETVILNLKQAINQLKKEISEKQNELDELIDKYGEQITVRNRTNAASRSDEDNKANSQNYWETGEGWSESVRDENGQYTVIGGPSWR